MIRGTTPTIVYKISEDFDLTRVSNLWVILKSSGNELVKEKSDVVVNATNHKITLELTQEETLAFNPGNIDTQIRFLSVSDKSFATPIKTLTLDKILKGGVIE